MNIATIILVFVIIWWLVFFPMLTIGVRTQEENNDNMVAGTVPSAPSNPRILRKMLITTGIAIILTVVYYLFAQSGLIDFRATALKP